MQARKLRDNIRDQIILDNRDLVFEPQLAFFQAGNLDLVGTACAGQGVDCGIEIAVLGPEHIEALFHFLFVHAPITLCCLFIAAQLIATWNRLAA